MGNEIAMFDGDFIKGQKVRTLVNDLLGADRYDVEFYGKDENGKSVSNVRYFYIIHSNNLNKTRKIIKIK